MPENWYLVFASVFTILVLLNAGAEFFLSWKYNQLGDTFITRTVNLMALVVGTFIIISYIGDIAMVIYEIIKKKIIRHSEAKGKSEGITETVKMFQEAGVEEDTINQVIELVNAAGITIEHSNGDTSTTTKSNNPK